MIPAARLLAAKAHRRQYDVIRRADAAADQAGAAVGAVWREVLRLLRSRPHWGEAFRQALPLFAAMTPLAQQRTATMLGRIARWGHRSAAADMVKSLPVKVLARAAYERLDDIRTAGVGLFDGFPLGPSSRLAHRHAVLREDEGPAAPAFTLSDLLAALRNRIVHASEPDHVSAAEIKSLLAKLLFPAPSPELVHRVIYAGDWQERLRATTRLAQPETLANILAGGIAAGKDPRQIARDLLPSVENVRSSARRIARTEAYRVAGVMQRECHRGLGDLQIGWELRATHDQHSRRWHWARNGRKYYFQPGPGQDGLDKCPFPPDEPADLGERPVKAPKIAFN